jgi:hypothetical protein
MALGLGRTGRRSQRSSGGTDAGRKRWLAGATAALMGGSLGLVALAAPAQATLSSALGPVDAVTGFPAYYQDTTNLRLEPCLDGPPLCFAKASDLVAPDGEAFYNNATATFANVGRNRTAKATMVMALEAAYASADSGQEVAFGRIRFTASGGLTRGAAYKVTYPYGSETYVADAGGAITANAGTQDIGALGPCLGPNAHTTGGACDFAEATTGKIGPFLKWDPAVAPAAPAGYLGDPSTTHTITGSPNSTNFVQIEGPNIGGPGVNLVKTDQFSLEGKVAGPVLATPAKLAFGSTQLGKTAAAQSVAIKNIGSNSLTIRNALLSSAAGDSPDFTVSPGTCTAGKVLARDATCSLSVTFSPKTVVAPHKATVLLRHDGVNSPERIPVTGSAAAVGTAPGVAFGPSSLAFGGQRLSTKSAAKQVTVTNNGTADLNVSKVALSGLDATDFSTSNDCVGKAVAAGESCTIDVVFAPQVTAGDKVATLTITDDAPNSPRTVALTGSANAGLTAVGAVDPATGFPSSYTDANGTQLQMCLDGPPNCLTAAADLTAPAGEGFYNNATAKLTTRGNGKAVMVLSLEGAYAGSATGQEIVFSRIRFTDSGGLRPNTVYTVTHPFGVDDYKTNGSGQIVKNQGTQDIGGLGPCGATAHNPGGACDFAAAMTGRFGPFLTWAPNPANLKDVPPAGFVGDAATDHKVTGSPLDTNFVRIEGPNVNPSSTSDACPTVDGPIADCVQTDLFVVAGKLAGTP